MPGIGFEIFVCQRDKPGGSTNDIKAVMVKLNAEIDHDEDLL